MRVWAYLKREVLNSDHYITYAEKIYTSGELAESELCEFGHILRSRYSPATTP